MHAFPRTATKRQEQFQILDCSSPSLGKSATRLSTFRDKLQNWYQNFIPRQTGVPKNSVFRSIRASYSNCNFEKKKTLSRYNHP